MDFKPHSIDKCYKVTTNVLKTVFSELEKENCFLEGIILKPSMVVNGEYNNDDVALGLVAEKTVECLTESVPSAVPGIVFLSGGQSATSATQNLNIMNEKNKNLPWKLSFSFGRAIQEPVLDIWSKNINDNAILQAARNAYIKRISLNALACKGEYSISME